MQIEMKVLENWTLWPLHSRHVDLALNDGNYDVTKIRDGCRVNKAMWDWQLSWDIVQFRAYQDALTKLKDDLHQIKKFKSHFAPNTELNRVKILVNFFSEIWIDLFTQMLSWMDFKRDLVNVAGSVLETLFGVVTVMDLD